MADQREHGLNPARDAPSALSRHSGRMSGLQMHLSCLFVIRHLLSARPHLLMEAETPGP